ncbi:MAG TPA: T9SS type A sorting domain-containing protein, partial [Candidatus Kapabacteria bacterium]|nr:T9SS type A sorting domain-containing protein [Candidatus Kapabacteria bacterium]
TYVSHGNVYLTRSTDVTATPAGCKWDTARMVNSLSRYGHCVNPSITWLPYQSDLNNPPRVVVIWEDTTASGSTITRDIKYSIYDTSGVISSGQSNVTFTSTSIASDVPAAPMVCPILPSDSTFKHYGDAVAVWADGQKDSLMIGIINPQAVSRGPIGVPNAVGGKFGAIEPGYNRKDTATLSDPADFELTWHDSSGIKYSYLLLNSISYMRSANHIFQYTLPEQVADTTWWGVNEHASLAVNTSAEPLVAWEQIGSRMMPVNCPASPGTVCMTDNFIGRMGITLRSKVRHDSSWGGFISIVKFSTFPLTAGILNNSIYSSICDGAESFFAPSVTAYKDETGLCRLYWTHGLPGSCGGDSIHYKALAFNGTGSSYINPDTTVSTSNGRTPTQPYSHWLPKAEHRTIWAQDSSTTEIMKRDGSCTVADNYVATSINDYNQACVHWNDTSNFSFVSGEYAMIDSAGSVTAMHQQPLSLTTAVHSINDAANQMRSQYFHIKNDTVKLICYNGVVLTDTTKSLHALGSTGGITFVVELRDSATGNLLQTLVPLGITHTFTSTSSPLGMDTVKVAGQSGKTCYFRLTVDTVGAPSTFSITPSQVYSENLLSGVIAGDTGALGKEIARTAPVPESAMPLLSAYPNPFTAVGHVSFTLSQSMPATITLYDMMGRMVKQLAVNQYFTAGNNTLTFNAANLPSGIYLCVFASANTQAEKLMILEK